MIDESILEAADLHPRRVMLKQAALEGFEIAILETGPAHPLCSEKRNLVAHRLSLHTLNPAANADYRPRVHCTRCGPSSPR